MPPRDPLSCLCQVGTMHLLEVVPNRLVVFQRLYCSSHNVAVDLFSFLPCCVCVCVCVCVCLVIFYSTSRARSTRGGMGKRCNARLKVFGLDLKGSGVTPLRF